MTLNQTNLKEQAQPLSQQILDSVEQYESNGDIVIIATYTFLSAIKNPALQDYTLAIVDQSAHDVLDELITRYGRKHSDLYGGVSEKTKEDALQTFMAMAQSVILGQSRVNAWLPDDSLDMQSLNGVPEYVFALAFELTLSQPERRDMSYGDMGEHEDQLRVVTTLARHDGENYRAFDFMEQQKHLN